MNTTGNQTNPIRPARPESRVRDHLANERTFLAWIRTALALIGIGFVLARMGLFLRQFALVTGPKVEPEIKGVQHYLIIGMIFLALGTMISLGSGWLYQRSRIAIDDGKYEPPTRIIAGLTLMVGTGSLIITGLLIWQWFF